MRGARGQMDFKHGLGGIIPADAGSTIILELADSLKRDHPRGCGEHLSMISSVKAASGSSPRMRGAPNRIGSPLIFLRIIPADAGSTGPNTRGYLHLGDHPRGCGEHRLDRPYSLIVQGSSPRMRGAPHSGHETRHSVGIIPADAGSTSSCGD